LSILRLLADLTGAGRLKAAKEEARKTLDEAEEEKRKILLEAREEALKARSSVDSEVKERRRELQRMERKFNQREEGLERKVQNLEKQEEGLVLKENELDQVREDLEDIKGKQLRQLEEVARLTLTDAKDLLLKKAEDEARHELARRYWEIEQQMKEEADQRARKVVTLAIHRLATDVVSEHTTSIVALPNDEMKGRLIGREGRNIKVLESLTGVDVIIDDTPEVVTVSCFDPVRREMARLALENLVKDGRIQPARIEEMVDRAQREIEETIQREGEKATLDSGVSGLNPELMKLLGRLKYRYSYGENVLKHCIEVGLLAGMMASEVGANVQLARVGGLLHDIGKALTHEVPGPHAEIGADLSARYGVNIATCACIKEHHDDEHSSIESFLVAAADAISAARPGARKESLEQYVQRLRELEDAAISFDGVERAFAIQAGREVRVMVKPGDVNDVQSASLARDIAKKVETELVFPGQIKVTVIRETRNTEFAR
jgi:ribonuclease Y